MKVVVDRGDLGKALYFDSVRVNLGLYQSDVNVIWDLAPHDLSIMLHLVPYKPVAVQAHGMQHYRKGMADMAYVTVFFEENYLANFHLNWLSPTKVRRITLAGDRRMMVYDDMESNEKIKSYINLAHQLNMDVLIETHNYEELLFWIETKNILIGVNNRNLKNMDVDINHSVQQISKLEKDCNVVCESGISSLEDLRYLIIRKIQMNAKKRESKKIMYLSKGELLRVNPIKV